MYEKICQIHTFLINDLNIPTYGAQAKGDNAEKAADVAGVAPAVATQTDEAAAAAAAVFLDDRRRI